MIVANPHPEPHPENLKPHRKGDPATVEKARKGGKASQQAQLRKKTMREWAQYFGELPLRSKDKVSLPKGADGIRDANLTMDGAVLAAMYSKAAKGDTRAASFLAQMKGQLSEEITVHTDPIDTLTEEQLDAILDAIARKKAGQSDE